jgi:flagellar hook-associated protein 3 FlgL
MQISTDARALRFLADLDRINSTEERVQREISSGYRVNRPSDAPEQMIDILQLRSDVQRAGDTDRNLGRVQSEVDTAEAALRVASQLLERARTVAAQTATDTATDRQGAAIEVRQLHQQLVDITKTLSEGRYVFSGDLDDQPMYDVDWTQSSGIAQRATAANTRQVLDVNGTAFSVARTAGQIFDTRNPDSTPAADNIFDAVYQLGVALEADDPVAIRAAQPKLAAALDHLGHQLTFYGNSQNRLDQARSLAQKVSATRTKELSDREDADFPAAATELSTVKVHREAALGAQSQQPRTSLFNYLG